LDHGLSKLWFDKLRIQLNSQSETPWVSRFGIRVSLLRAIALDLVDWVPHGSSGDNKLPLNHPRYLRYEKENKPTARGLVVDGLIKCAVTIEIATHRQYAQPI